jgi:hypothetical protein
MARRTKKRRTKRVSVAGKRIVDAGRTLAQARSMQRDTNAAAKGDPSCPRGAKAVIRKNPNSYLPYEIWVTKSCRYV